MLWSNYFIPTLKDTAAEDSQVISNSLMLKSGMIRKTASGIYTWLPLGLRVLNKVENIVREEMNNAGAHEVLMPMVQPKDLWDESERWNKFGPELLRFKDRHDRDFCLGPTHEEVITDLIKNNVKSYKELPLNIYQIQTKFRDEIRPRYGVMRSREFLMKDSYSFHLSEECLEDTYQIMRKAYSNILKRIGLNFKIVKADSGAIGGDRSEEFHVLAENGEDTLAVSDSSDYAVNAELLLENDQDAQSLEGQKSPDGNGLLEITKGIEVGHIFQLGKLYSENMNATVLDDSGTAKNMHMGCYGVGISRIVAASIEQNFDEKGIIWPKSISPFNLSIITIGADKDKNIEASSKKLYQDLSQKGFEVILDDRNDGFGKKIKDNELVGIPLSIVFGKNFSENDEVEIIFRDGKKIISTISKVEEII
tara:strand:- start:19771 stop:21036 length:1266 start_codon:yes stop_codon:yes gene_type:complete